MKKILFLFLLFAVTGCTVSKKKNTKSESLQSINEKIANKNIDKSETLQIIEALASDKFQGRESGTVGYDLAASYVEDFFIENNIKSYFKDTYRDSVFVHNKISTNVVALIGDYDKKKQHIIISAHLDHLGVTDFQEDSIYNGANDNASGVTAVLQIAKKLKDYTFDKNIIVALFTGEESGLVGSRHLAKKLRAEKLNLAYMINFEMIGKILTLGENKVYITGFDKSNIAKKMNEMHDEEFVYYLPEEITYNLFYRSDNYSFYEEFKIPSHTISTFDFKNYDHYHKTTDEAKLLDIVNMNNLINTTSNIIFKLLNGNIEIKTVN